MPPSDDDRIRLQHMRDAATEAMQHASGRVRADLDADRQLMHSLVRCIEIIGEAASHVSADFRHSHPGTPWSRIVGARNRMTHAYFDINLDIVWRTTTDELPRLVAQLDGMLAE